MSGRGRRPECHVEAVGAPCVVVYETGMSHALKASRALCWLALALSPSFSACGARSDLLPADESESESNPGTDTGTGQQCVADGEPCGPSTAQCCGATCGGGFCGACKEDEVVVLASGEETFNIYAFSADETSVYWGSEKENGLIRKIDKLGGPPLTIASGVPFTRSFVNDGTSLYFTSEVGVGVVSTSGGEVVILAPPPATGSEPWQLAQDSTTLYWSSVFLGEIWSIPKQGGTPTLLLSQGDLTGGIAVDDTSVYFDGDTQNLFKMPKLGGPLEVLDSNGGAWDIVVDDENVYFSSACANCGQLRRVAKSGGSSVVLDSTDPGQGIAIDGQSVYYAAINWESDPAGSGVRKVSKSGGVPSKVAFGLALMVAVDDTCVYWMNSDGEIKKAHK